MDHKINERYAVGRKSEYSEASYLYGCKKLFEGSLENIRTIGGEDYACPAIDLGHQAGPIYNNLKLIALFELVEGTTTPSEVVVDLSINLYGHREEIDIAEGSEVYTYYGSAEMEYPAQEWSFSQTPHTIYLEVVGETEEDQLTIYYQESL